MKNVYSLLSCLLLANISTGQTSGLLFDDNFTSLTTGNLGSQNNWTLFGTGPDIQVANGSFLSMPNYVSGGNYLTMGTIMSGGNYDGRDSYKNFNGNQTVSGNAASSNNTVFYISFVVRVSTPRRNGANVDWLFSLRTNDSKTLAHFFIKQSSVNASKINFGINSKPETDSTKAKWTGREYDLNTTYLIVMRYDVVHNTSNDQAYLWVNPNLASQPGTSTADITFTNGQEDYSSSSSINAFQLHQLPYCSSVQFDAFKVSYASGGANTATNASASWSSLGAAGTPLPVNLTEFTASRNLQGNGVLNWATASESNSSHFDVERSLDGRNWQTIGSTQAAGNSNQQRSYTYTDRTAPVSTCYYRLKQVDLDGAYVHTSTKTVKGTGAESTVQISSTPGGSIYVNFSSVCEGKVELQLFNTQGQLLSKTQVVNPVGNIQLSTNKLQKGIYIVRVSNGSDLQQAKQVAF